MTLLYTSRAGTTWGWLEHCTCKRTYTEPDPHQHVQKCVRTNKKGCDLWFLRKVWQRTNCRNCSKWTRLLLKAVQHAPLQRQRFISHFRHADHSLNMPLDSDSAQYCMCKMLRTKSSYCDATANYIGMLCKEHLPLMKIHSTIIIIAPHTSTIKQHHRETWYARTSRFKTTQTNLLPGTFTIYETF